MATEREPYAIFNDAFADKPRAGDADTFPFFSRLPVELRRQVWAHCMSQRRFIRIQLDNERREQFPPLYTTENELGNIISGCPYRVKAFTTREWSPTTLIRVNHEARDVFRSVYRVRLPLPVKGGDRTVKSLYINPENDIIWAGWRNHTPAEPVFTSLLHDLVAYDPKGVGVVHLAVGGPDMNDTGLLERVDPDRLPAPARESITKIVSSSLQTLYALIVPYSGRNTIGVMSYPFAQFHRNRSIPILPNTQSCTFLERDPRPIEADLTHVAVETDPRRFIFHWNRFKARFGVTRRIETRYILGSAGVLPRMVDDRDGFTEMLDKEDEHWESYLSMVNKPVWGDRMSEQEYIAQRTTLPQAVGFWIFPEEALGEVPEDQIHWEPKMMKDLSKFHPGICVFNLP